MIQSLSNDSTIQPIATNRSIQGVGVSGQRQKFALVRGVKTLAIHVTLTGDVTIGTADASAIVDTGSLLSVCDECGVNDAGTDRLPTNPLDMRFLTEVFSGQPVQAIRQTLLSHTTNGGVTHLKERFTLFCSPPGIAVREEVTLVEKSSGANAVYDFYIKQTGAADGGGSRIATAGGGTVVVSNLSASVEQEFLPYAGLPIFQPVFEPDNIAVAQANPTLQKYLTRDKYMLATLFREDITGNGPRVGDILTSFKLARTNGKFVGDEFYSKDSYQAYFERSSGGSVYTLGGVNPYTMFWFARGGKLSKIVPPGDQNFLATLNVAPSATSGASEIAITHWMLQRDNFVDPTTGRRITLTDAQVATRKLTIG